MLILTRKIGERIRVETPAGDIWLTMLDGAVRCDMGEGEPQFAAIGDGVYYDVGREFAEIRLLEMRSPSMGHRLGIEAPRGWSVLREELIGKPRKLCIDELK